jgi:hypothetical protein
VPCLEPEFETEGLYKEDGFPSPSLILPTTTSQREVFLFAFVRSRVTALEVSFVHNVCKSICWVSLPLSSRR